MGGQCMTNQFSVDSKASFFAIFGGQFLDLQNAMKFGDVSKVLPRMHFCHGEARIEPAAVAEKKGAKVHGSL